MLLDNPTNFEGKDDLENLSRLDKFLYGRMQVPEEIFFKQARLKASAFLGINEWSELEQSSEITIPNRYSLRAYETSINTCKDGRERALLWDIDDNGQIFEIYPEAVGAKVDIFHKKGASVKIKFSNNSVVNIFQETILKTFFSNPIVGHYHTHPDLTNMQAIMPEEFDNLDDLSITSIRTNSEIKGEKTLKFLDFIEPVFSGGDLITKLSYRRYLRTMGLGSKHGLLLLVNKGYDLPKIQTYKAPREYNANLEILVSQYLEALYNNASPLELRELELARIPLLVEFCKKEGMYLYFSPNFEPTLKRLA